MTPTHAAATDQHEQTQVRTARYNVVPCCQDTNKRASSAHRGSDGKLDATTVPVEVAAARQTACEPDGDTTTSAPKYEPADGDTYPATSNEDAFNARPRGLLPTVLGATSPDGGTTLIYSLSAAWMSRSDKLSQVISEPLELASSPGASGACDELSSRSVVDSVSQWLVDVAASSDNSNVSSAGLGAPSRRKCVSGIGERHQALRK